MHWKQGRYVLPALVLLVAAGTAGLAHFLSDGKMRSSQALRAARLSGSPQSVAAGTQKPESTSDSASLPIPVTVESARTPSRKSANGAPLTAAQVLALQGLAGGSGSANRALEPLRAWARRDPAGCGRWVLDHLEGIPQRRSLEEVVTTWTQHQTPLAALEWLDEQTQFHPDLPGLKTAYALAVSALARQDGANAAAWLSAHPAQGAVENWQSLLAAWTEQNPPAALQWTTGASLDVELRQALLPDLLADFHDPAATALLLNGIDPLLADDAMTRAAKATSVTYPDFALSLARGITDPLTREQTANRILAQWLTVDASRANLYATQHYLALPAATAEKAGGETRDQSSETVPDDAVAVLPH